MIVQEEQGCPGKCRDLLRQYKARAGQPVYSKGEKYCTRCKIIFYKPDFLKCLYCNKKLRGRLL